MKSTLTMCAALLVAGAAGQTASAQYPAYPYPGPAMAGPIGAPPGFAPNPYLPGYGQPPAQPQAESTECQECQYGLHPKLKRLFRFGKKSHGHADGCPEGDGHKHGHIHGAAAAVKGKVHGLGAGILGLFGGGGGGGDGAGDGGMGYGGPPQGGTLAFPHHPFTRSPRDFFMYDMP